MSSLDDKLLGIIKLIQKDYQKYAEPSNADERIAQIKQAFADHLLSYTQDMVDGKLLSGQEFYDRFKKEFVKTHNGMPLTSMEAKMREAVERASGLGDN